MSLPKLRVLYATNNQIESVNNFNQSTCVPQLQELYLKGNRIRDCSFVKNLINLEFLDLSYNQLDTITDLDSHSCLRELNLSHNQFKFIPFVKGLSTLNMSHNQIEWITLVRKNEHHGSLNSSSTLKELDSPRNLNGKPLHHESADEIELPQNNELESSSADFDEGIESNLSSSQRSQIQENTDRLQTLGSTLVILNLSDNQIHTIQSSISGLAQSLEELNLSGNRLTTLSRHLTQLKSLTIS